MRQGVATVVTCQRATGGTRSENTFSRPLPYMIYLKLVVNAYLTNCLNKVGRQIQMKVKQADNTVVILHRLCGFIDACCFVEMSSLEYYWNQYVIHNNWRITSAKLKKIRKYLKKNWSTSQLSVTHWRQQNSYCDLRNLDTLKEVFILQNL